MCDFCVSISPIRFFFLLLSPPPLLKIYFHLEPKRAPWGVVTEVKAVL